MCDQAGHDYDQNAGQEEEKYVVHDELVDVLLENHTADRYLACCAN